MTKTVPAIHCIAAYSCIEWLQTDKNISGCVLAALAVTGGGGVSWQHGFVVVHVVPSCEFSCCALLIQGPSQSLCTGVHADSGHTVKVVGLETAVSLSTPPTADGGQRLF